MWIKLTHLSRSDIGAVDVRLGIAAGINLVILKASL